MKRLASAIFFAMLLTSALVGRSFAASLGNDDVLGLLAAGMSEATVLQAIDSADPPRFDTTAAGLIKLKQGGASEAVIQRVLSRQSGKPTTANAAVTSRPTSGGECVIEAPVAGILTVRADDNFVQVPYQSIKMEIQSNAVAAVFTLGIVSPKSSARTRLEGTRAKLRLHERTPVFLDMLFPVGRRDVEQMFYLMRFDVQSNSRVVEMLRTEGGIWNSVDVKDAAFKTRVSIVGEMVSEQCRFEGKSYAQYRIKPASPLEPGEYAYIQITQGGLAANVHDFGVDE